MPSQDVTDGRSQTPLFDEPTKVRTGPLGWIEPAVHWFTESTRPEAVASREVVNGWYREFPDPDGRFAARLRSKVNVDHYQALDELYVYHLLRHTHDIHYEVGDVGPDFRVYEEGACVGGVEVLSLFQREDWSVDERRHWRLADELNRRILPTDGYLVDFEIEGAQQDPPPRRVADFIRRELARLPPHRELLQGLGDRVTRAERPSAIYCRDGVRIRMNFLPMVAGARAKSDPDSRIVGTGPVIGGMVNSAERLRDRIVAKAGGRYDIADVPFVVAVGVHDTSARMTRFSRRCTAESPWSSRRASSFAATMVSSAQTENTGRGAIVECPVSLSSMACALGSRSRQMSRCTTTRTRPGPRPTI